MILRDDNKEGENKMERKKVREKIIVLSNIDIKE